MRTTRNKRRILDAMASGIELRPREQGGAELYGPWSREVSAVVPADVVNELLASGDIVRGDGCFNLGEDR